MKLKSVTPFLICLLCLFSFQVSFCQPDLKPSNLVVLNSTFERGNFLDITFDVQNVGISASTNTHVGIYMSSPINPYDAVLLSQISIESIDTGITKTNIPFHFPIPYNTVVGQRKIYVKVDPLNEVSEINEGNNFLATPTIIISSNTVSLQKTPYPYILVHGIKGSSASWDSLSLLLMNQLGWSFGGNLNFCLNQDGNKATSDLSTDYKDWTDASTLVPADFYVINFNVDSSGQSLNGNSSLSYSNQSNQSGIVKQGLGIRDAIKHVLQVTGKDKVILVCHSMGGLSSREYLQNTSIWQTDGMHHVAKLYTTATPHNGSNATLSGISSLGGLDEASEAVRDLRISYYYSGDRGVYLHGGIEADSVMDDSYWFNFYNTDVNCNGIEGDAIIGLNQKNIPIDLSYSCVIGIDGQYLISGDQEDGIVDSASANLNRRYLAPFYADTILAKPPDDAPALSFWHTMLADEKEFNIRGMDESNDIDKAYKIELNKQYYGLITKQSMGNPNAPFDYDFYEINISSNKPINIYFSNIPVSSFEISLYNASPSILFSIPLNGKNIIDTTLYNLTSGKYFLRIKGLPEIDSWKYPYYFKIDEVLENDHCTGAIVLATSTSCSPILATNTNASQSVAPCNGVNYVAKDAWFKFNSTDTTATVTVSGMAGFDVVLEVFDNGSCPNNFNTIACVDDPLISSATEQAVLHNLVVGQTYFILVHGYNSTSGDFNICVTVPQNNNSNTPANDNCIGATSLQVGSFCNFTLGNTANSTQSSPGCNGLNAIHDTWYSFVANGTTVRMVAQSLNNFDAVVELSSSCPSFSSPLYCIDQTASNGIENQDFTNLVIGNTYYLRVYDKNLGYGSFYICLINNTINSQKEALEDVVKIYPNPANTSLNINLEKLVRENGSIKLFNPIGQLVLEEMFTTNQREILVDLSSFSNGVYSIQVFSGSQILNENIVISK